MNKFVFAVSLLMLSCVSVNNKSPNSKTLDYYGFIIEKRVYNRKWIDAQTTYSFVFDSILTKKDTRTYIMNLDLTDNFIYVNHCSGDKEFREENENFKNEIDSLFNLEATMNISSKFMNRKKFIVKSKDSLTISVSKVKVRFAICSESFLFSEIQTQAIYICPYKLNYVKMTLHEKKYFEKRDALKNW